MFKFTNEKLEIEKLKMAVERRIFGRHLIVGSGESRQFWEDMLRLALNKKPKHFEEVKEDNANETV